MKSQTKRTKAIKILELLPDVFMKLSDKEQELSLAIYRELAKGAPASNEKLELSTSLNRNDIAEILDRWTGIFYNNDNNIIGYWGLATQEMPHKIKLENSTIWGWCAWDTLFIPQLINKSATIISKDHLTKEELEIQLDDNGNVINATTDIVLSMVIPDEEKITEDVVNSFCHFIHFFKNRENGKKWTKEHEGTFLITLEEAIELSKTKNRMQFRNEFNTVKENN